MKKFLKKLFCRHNYEKISWYEVVHPHSLERFSMRIYKCSKCGKQIKVDGRMDPYVK